MTVTPIDGVRYWYDESASAFVAPSRPSLPLSKSYDWSDSNHPSAYASSADWESRMPSGVPVVPLQTGAGDFYTNLSNTVNAASGRVIVRLPEGVYTLTSFRPAGTTDPASSYAFGFWFPKLAGFTGAGYDRTFVELAANSMSAAQLGTLRAMTTTSANSPNQMALCRIDSSTSQPFFLGGMTFRSDWQNPLTSTAVSGIVTPQPAPHQGVNLYTDTIGSGVVSHVRFQGAGRAATSLPPFEQANVTSQKNQIQWFNCDFDGRLSDAFDVSRPRKCGVWMGNNERVSEMTDCWFHHSNVSRYAANDQNLSVPALSTHYYLTRCKAEQITNTHNDGYGGYTNATPFGWESTNAQITVTNCIVSQDNSYTDGSIAQDFQLTAVNGVDRQGGRMTVNGGDYRNVWSQLNGFVCFRITSSYWLNDGLNTTISVYHKDGQRLYPYTVTAWPPTAAQLRAANVLPTTHYIVRNS